MQHRSRIASAVVAAGLSLSMAFGAVAPAVANAYTVTINKIAENGGDIRYDGYLIFKGTVAEDDKVSGITWSSDEMKTVVEAAIKEEDGSYAGTTAQDAADFIAAHITGTTSTTKVDNSSFAQDLAQAIVTADPTIDPTLNDVEPGSATDVDQAGYYLFVTDPTTTKKTDPTTTNAGTSPILAVLGGRDVTVTEKTKLPTVDKHVKNDTPSATWGKWADSEMSQDVSYRLTGTVADNVQTYKTYEYSFTDTLPAGMTPDTSTLEVRIGTGVDETSATKVETSGSSYTVSYENNVLTVSFDDLKAAKDESGNAISVTGDSKVYVLYTAKLDPEKLSSIVVDGVGNENGVTLTYSNNPEFGGTGTTEEKRAKDFTYGFALYKVDQGTEQPIQGVKFSITTTGDEKSADTLYVQADGSTSTTEYYFVTDADGKISATGLDVGTYTVHEDETTLPSGYTTGVDDFTFTIAPKYEDASGADITEDNSKEAASATLSSELSTKQSDQVKQGTIDPASDKGDNVLQMASDSAVTSGVVNITVGNVKSVTLPVTGQAGIAATFVAGGALVAFGVWRSRRAHQDDEA